MNVRDARISDAATLASIYNHYIDHSTATFDLIHNSERDMRNKMLACSEVSPFLVCEDDHGKILGYAHAGKHKPKKAYQWSVDTTIYVTPHLRHKGVGSLLYHALIKDLKDSGYCDAYAGITQPNPESVAFHEKLGFRHRVSYEKIGFKHGAWLDVGWWVLSLNPHDSSPQDPRPRLADPTAINRDSYTLSSMPSRMQAADMHAMLIRSHWAGQRTLNTVISSAQNSLCYGVFHNERQVAMARVVSDFSTFAYLCDVFVHEDHRGQGLSKWMMDEIMRHPDLQVLRRFVLATKDAHSLYARYGFVPLNEDEIRRFMGIRRDGV